MLVQSRRWILVIVGVMAIGAVAVFAIPHVSGSTARDKSETTGGTTVRQGNREQLPTNKIIPADVTGPHYHWAPRTGDGSN